MSRVIEKKPGPRGLKTGLGGGWLAARINQRMGTPPSRLSPSLASASRLALTVGVGVLGVVMAHYPMIFSGFARIQTDLGDTRLIHYLLEHGYLWVRRVPGHLDFWNPPFFYPAPNAAAYSDALVSVGPVYWLWRILGASPGPVVRLVDGDDVGAQLCGRLAAIPQGPRIRRAGRGGGGGAGGLRRAAVEPDESPAVTAVFLPAIDVVCPGAAGR